MPESREITWQEVRKHSAKDDGWIVVHGQVYNVTDYLEGHPGGPEWILEWLGRDATQAFETKGSLGVGHSDFAKQEMQKLLVGLVSGPEPK